MVPGCRKRSAKREQAPSGASARAVTTSAASGGDLLDAPACTVAGNAAVARATSRRNAALRWSLSTRCDLRHAEDRQHQTRKAGAAAEIDQHAGAARRRSARSCAEIERRGGATGSGRVAGADQIDRAAATAVSRSSIGLQARPVFHVKHRAARPALPGVSGAGTSGRLLGVPIEQRSAPPASCPGCARRRPSVAGCTARQLLAQLVGQAARSRQSRDRPAAAAPRRAGRPRCPPPGGRR